MVAETRAQAPASVNWIWWICQGVRTNRSGATFQCEAKLLRRSEDFCGSFEIVCHSCKTTNLIQR